MEEICRCDGGMCMAWNKVHSPPSCSPQHTSTPPLIAIVEDRPWIFPSHSQRANHRQIHVQRADRFSTHSTQPLPHNFAVPTSLCAHSQFPIAHSTPNTLAFTFISFSFFFLFFFHPLPSVLSFLPSLSSLLALTFLPPCW